MMLNVRWTVLAAAVERTTSRSVFARQSHEKEIAMKIKMRPASSSVPATPIPSAAEQDTETPNFHEAECAWVPGTTDRIRFTLLRSGKAVHEHGKKTVVRELAVARLAVMFGRSLMDDLYLRGRARLRLSDGQLLELA
jgi:hypothetical protein